MTKRKVIIIRYKTNATTNQIAAQALVEFYAYGEATIHPTPFGMVSCLMTKATAEAIYQKLIGANIGDHFSVIEVDADDVPIKIFTSREGLSNTVEVSLAESTEEQLQAELDALLDKIAVNGRGSLSEVEKQRLEFLSNRD